MGEHIMLSDAMLLFDSYSPDCRRLHDSFRKAGCEWPAVVLEENDFLPEEVMSVYDMFLGYFGDRGKKSGIGKPRFFNEIAVPDYWSINSGAGVADYGTVTYRHEEKGRIYYLESAQKYLVKAVDWFDRRGNVLFRDHYNRYGAVCARTVFNVQGKELGKTWFSAEGQEAITLNYVTGDWIVNDGGRIRFFKSKMNMMLYFFRRAGFERGQIFYNSLADPFVVSDGLTAPEKWDALFWQDGIGDMIPEKMQRILNGQTSRTGRILVQRRDAYNRLLELGADPGIVQRMGYVFEFKKDNGHKPRALICTNADNIEHCEELIRELPGMHFHIAAITSMSSKLLDMGKYDNVSLYPGAQAGTFQELFQLCDYYFDINHWSEIVSAVYQAFLHNQLIFAFEETLHNRTYVADAHIYPVAEFDRMVMDVREAMADSEIMEHRLEMQRKDGMSEEKETLMATLEQGFTKLTKNHNMDDCAFLSTVLNESYDGNLALSWTFKGTPDGFLVYDMYGEPAEETENVYGHYLLVKNYERTAGFVIKAYVNTLKGRLILAESHPVYLDANWHNKAVVSLVMPAYNAEQYIARSIDTALAQSFADLEIIIVNDGSTDGTQVIIDWYKERYPQIKSVYQPNGGLVSARNTGVKHASGEYICFVDNDDMIRPDMVEKLYNSIRKNECDIAISSAYMMINGEYREIAGYSVIENTAVSVDEFLEHYIGNPCPMIWNKLYRTSLVRERPLATVTYEDDAWTPYILSYAERVCYVNEHLYEYDRMIRKTTAIDVSRNKPIEEKMNDYKEVIVFFLKNGNPQRRKLLKRLAIKIVEMWRAALSSPQYDELKEEVEQYM